MTIKINPTARRALIFTAIGAFAAAITLGITHRFNFGEWMADWALVSLVALGLFSFAGKDD